VNVHPHKPHGPHEAADEEVPGALPVEPDLGPAPPVVPPAPQDEPTAPDV
jgi:hypothetical protein